MIPLLLGPLACVTDPGTTAHVAESDTSAGCAEAVASEPVCACEATLSWEGLDPSPDVVDWFVVEGPLDAVVETYCADAMTQSQLLAGGSFPLSENRRSSEIVDLRPYDGYVLFSYALGEDYAALGSFLAEITSESTNAGASF